MKVFLPVFLMLAFCVQIIAQNNTSGKVIYEQIVKMEIKLEGDASQFASMLPKERKSKKVLYFNPESSLYENLTDDEDEQMHLSSGGGNVMIKMQEPENKVVTSLSEKRQYEQREFMTRTFLIEGDVSNTWKLTGNQKMILDYPCQEATIEKDSTTYSAWFTPAIPVSAGPGGYCGLPGLILAVESSDGNNTTTAVSVELSDAEKDKISRPKKGKKVSREEFDKIVEEKMKEMGAEGAGGGHQIMIRIER